MIKLPPVLQPRQLAELRVRHRDVRLLDVRTPMEFALAHVEGAYNVPLDRIEAHLPAMRDLDAPLVLVCRSDARARAAGELLRGTGLRGVHVLEGGMLAWRAEGLPVRRGPFAAGTLVRRGIGAAGIALGLLAARQNPVLAVMLTFVGLRQVMGMSAFPCAAAGRCDRAGDDTDQVVRALLDARPVGERSASPAW